MATRNLLCRALFWACSGLSAFGVNASPVFINNASFETLPPGGLPFGCGIGCSYSEGLVPGWTVTGGSTGQFRPGSPANMAYFDSIPDGLTVAYTNGGSLSQTVGATVQLGFIYQLLVDQGLRRDIPDPGVIELLIGGTPIVASGVAAAPGGWSTYTATYIGTAADVGKSISILLISAGPQGDWDNVRLDAGPVSTAIPEPATIALVGIALAGLGMQRRRPTH